ncbi:MAG: histidine kinase [Porticoccaceae bacterium]
MISRITTGVRWRRDDAEYFLPDLYRGEGLAWVAIATGLLSVLVVVAKNGVSDFSWGDLGMAALTALWILLLSAIALRLTREWLADWSRALAAAVSFAIILLVAAIISLAGQWLLLVTGAVAGSRIEPLRVIEHVIMAGVCAAILLSHLQLQQTLLTLRKAEREARIQALQSRIRPHFLFNSMNIIASLIGSDPEKAERVVEDLADLFRHALTDNHNLVPLRDELSLCRRYISIEKLRLGERLEAVWQIDDYGEGVEIPSLALQPVIENAVYHGIQLLPEGGVIVVKVRRYQDRIAISVENPRNPRMQHNKGNKIAMDNVLSRLKAHFGPSVSLRAEVQESCYITHISYPVTEGG